MSTLFNELREKESVFVKRNNYADSINGAIWQLEKKNGTIKIKVNWILDITCADLAELQQQVLAKMVELNNKEFDRTYEYKTRISLEDLYDALFPDETDDEYFFSESGFAFGESLEKLH